MKTLVDEQEIQSNPAIERDERSRHEAPKIGVRQRVAVPATPPAAQSQTDCYESCLDLAAEFLGRG
ncbi:MAG TPA: hypothetical protein VIJ01_18960 [Candidatus Angelobacter sp.]